MARGLTKPLGASAMSRRSCGPNLETKPPAKPSTTFISSVTCREDVIQLRDVAAKNCVHDENLSKKSWNASESNSRVSVFPCADAPLFESKAEADPILDGSIDEARNATQKCFQFPGRGRKSKQNILSRVYTVWKRFRFASKRGDSIVNPEEVFCSQEGCAV